MSKSYRIPTWSPSKQWHYTTFPDRNKWREFVKSLFMEPGLYPMDETTEQWNIHARHFNKSTPHLYCEAPEGSKDFQEYWDGEKEKCRKGVIYHNDKGDTWYLPRFYYHWLNFLQIYNKSVGDFTFPEVRDVQYHMALYETLASLYDLNAATLKARQKASSYFHLCKLYNKYLFENGYVGKIGASHKQYMINPNGSWKFLDHYHNFTNSHTAWACMNNPDKPLEWQQKVETKTTDGRKVKIGTMASITGITFEKDPTAGVGGPCTEFFYEEGGIAPTADQTYIYMKSALKEGNVVSGIFTIAGSVGKLEQAGPLRTFVQNPIGNDFYPVTTNLLDKHGTTGQSALFIPEHWGMPPFIDKYGKSMIKEALEFLDQEDYNWKNGYIDENGQKVPPKTPELYQLERSQHPRNIEEAFAIRTVSVFPIKHTSRQIKRIEDGDVYLRYVDLERGDNGEITYKKAEREPIPYTASSSAIMTMPDKRGCVVIHQHPGTNPEWMTYFWSADPVETGATSTSESLAAIYIYMNRIEVTKIDAEGNSKTYIEGDKLVAEWVGRYDDVNDTNEQMSLLIEYYNAWGISERNKPSLNTYMILKKRTRHLASSDEMLFDSESIGIPANHYGWTNTTGTWKKIIQYGVDSLSEELEEAHTDEDTGKVTPARYGGDRIPFIGLLKEMQSYQHGVNADRVVAYCALITFAKLQQAKQRIGHRTEREKVPENSRTFTPQNFLRSIGQRQQGAIVPKTSFLRTIGKQSITRKQ
jgi:hypothetical protein